VLADGRASRGAEDAPRRLGMMVRHQGTPTYWHHGAAGNRRDMLTQFYWSRFQGGIMNRVVKAGLALSALLAGLFLGGAAAFGQSPSSGTIQI
jgi:hypothetical protein